MFGTSTLIGEAFKPLAFCVESRRSNLLSYLPPYGGDAWPFSSHPQQTTVPSRLSPQECAEPTETEVNSPSGGAAWPLESLPQQATVPSALTPQVWLYPPLTETNSPSVGADPIEPLWPQHATLPSVCTPQL